MNPQGEKRGQAGYLTTCCNIYSGPNIIAEYNEGSTASSPGNEYIYSGGIDSLAMVAFNNNAKRLSAFRNQQWSIVGLVDFDTQVLEEQYAYNVFGERTILDGAGNERNTSAFNNRFGYTSREHDDETGLMFYRARYYDPITGEFISQDPMEYVDGASMYRGYFVGRGIDVTGLCCDVGFADPFRVTKECTVAPHPQRGGQTVVFEVQSKFEFLGECECCEYRQYVNHKKFKISVITKAGDEIIIADTTVNEHGKEDCLTEWLFLPVFPYIHTPYTFCYGHRSNPCREASDCYRPSQANGCHYKNRDSPHFLVTKELVRIVKRDLGIKEEIVQVKVSYGISLRAAILDLCEGEEIFTKEFSKTCEGTIDVSDL